MPRGGRGRNRTSTSTETYQSPLTNAEVDSFEYFDLSIRELVYRAKWIATRFTGQELKLSSMLGRQRDFQTYVEGWIKSYELKPRGYDVFKNHWKRIRPWLDLQTRLACEQIFSDRGSPYTQLVSGFRPLD